jgi:TolA-binding protein
VKAAMAEVERGLNDAKLAEGPRQSLLAYQLELARASGDAARARQIADRLGNTPATPNAPGNAAATAAPAVNPALKLQLAFLALDKKDYDAAAKEIQSSAALFVEPEQQVEALYCLAEARAGLAKDDAGSQKDVALAYMRVVARAKSGRVQSPRVAESLLKTAAVHEKLKANPEALMLYQQVAEEFKDDANVARRAADGIARLGAAAQAST